jgi:hypothetical protein
MKHYLLLAICMAAVSLGGCAKESGFPEATGKGSVRAINAIPTSPTFAFLIQERGIGNVTYKSASSPSSFDDLEYTFNFETVLAGNQTQTRVASQFLDVEADKDYTFVISGAIASPDITLWQGDVREWADTDTVFDSQFGHTAASLGAIDVYFADEAVVPAPGGAIGTLAFGEFLPAVEFPEGDYVLTITAAGDETDVLFVSNPITVAARSSFLISVFDPDANDLSPWSVSLFNLIAGGSSLLDDADSRPPGRFFHTSLNFGATDIYIDDPLTAPFVANHMFGDITADLPVPAGTLPITYTDVDPMTSILLDLDQSVFNGVHHQFYIVRATDGADAFVVSRPDRRSVETAGKLSVINTASGHDLVDVYIGLTGELIDAETQELIEGLFPLIPFLPLTGDPIQLSLAAGSYEIHVTVAGDNTTRLAGPIFLDLSLGDVREAIIYENVDPTMVDFVFVPAP